MVGDDRGQLILVGSIAIALILIGLVVVVNSAVYTETVGDQGTVETVKEAGTMGLAVERSAAAAVAANDSTDFSDDPAPESDLQAEVGGRLSPQLANMTADRSGAFVAVEYNRTVETGTRIVQDDTREFTDSTGALADWTPMGNGSSGDVGRFVVTIDEPASNLSGDFRVYINGDGGNTSELRLSDGGSGAIAIELTDDAPAETCSSVAATNDTVRIDLTRGVVYEDRDCVVEAFRHVEPPYTIEFDDGDEISGTYEIVTDEAYLDLATNVDYGVPATSSDPHLDAVVWTAGIAYTYDVDEATTVTREKEVEIYG